MCSACVPSTCEGQWRISEPENKDYYDSTCVVQELNSGSSARASVLNCQTIYSPSVSVSLGFQ